MTTPLAENRIWDRAVSTGQFVIATILLTGAILGAYVQVKVERTADQIHIEAIADQVKRLQGQVDTVQTQQTTILVQVSQLNGKVDTLITQLSSVDEGKSHSKRK